MVVERTVQGFNLGSATGENLQSRGPEVLFSTSLHWVLPH